MRVGDHGKRGLGRRLEQCFERSQRQLQRLHELGRGLPVVALEPAHAAVPALARAQIGLRALQRGGDTFQPLAEVGRAEGRELERAQAVPVFLRRQAQAAQRMLEQRDERHRLEAPGGRLDDQIEEGADGRGGKRRVAGVVGRHAPGLEPDGNPTRERAVGRDERGRAAGRLRHLAQDEGDSLRLVLGARCLQDGDAVECPGHLALIGIGDETVPALGGPGRTHGLADECRTRARYGRRRAAGQSQHLIAPHAERVDELLQAELGMLGVTRLLGIVRQDPGPARLVERLVERRQHDGAVRQAGDHAQHLRHHGGAAHDAGDDHGRGRRRLLPCARLGQYQGLVALHLGDAALALEVRRPVLGDDLQEGQRRAPVLSVGLGDEAGHAGRVDVLDLHRVHQTGKLAREPCRLCRRSGSRRDIRTEIAIGAVAAALGLGPRQHQLGERQPALDLPDRRRDLAGARGKVVGAREHGGLLARAYDGPDLGQQERGAACGSQERFLQRPRGAPRRQQDGHVGKI